MTKRTALDADLGQGAGQGECVLLIDDDPVVRLLTATALIERGWRVVEASGGLAALAVFARSQPDVVVLDALMPEMDGFASCERLRALSGGAHLPILMLTGLDDEMSIARAYEAGATDFFVKTSSQWTLLSERLRYMLRAARTREALAHSQAKLTKAQRIARLGSWEWDVAAGWMRASEEFFAIAGLPVNEHGLADWFVWSRILEEDRRSLSGLLTRARNEDKPVQFECRIVRANGALRTVHVEAEIERDTAGSPKIVHGIVQDVTERKQAEDQIRQLANFDSLTGLPNRRFFRDQFADSIARARAKGTQVAVLFIDVDRFKKVNDTLGHQIGDQLLREVAVRLYAAVRETDTVARGDEADTGHADPFSCSVARLGGDEFTVLLTDMPDAAIAPRVAQRLLELLRAPINCSGHELFATASIGVATYPRDGDDVETLLRKADVAMYAVKDAGRNGWQAFDESMRVASADRWRLETALHRALERSELVLHFQPKVDVSTRKVVGAEALMRWNRDGELVPPGQFIGLAEETGLIVPITEWAITEVARQLSAWRDAGVPLVPISVNISSRHVQRADIVAPIRHALAEHHVPPSLMELELTESVLMQNIDTAVSLLGQLKTLGVSISIDDFGTGYSSLAYLNRLPIDTLKIDRSFVGDLDGGADNATIVAAIIAMGRSLRMRVVAEGVESESQMLRLAEQGCVLQQGWLFARALPAEQFARFLNDAAGGLSQLSGLSEQVRL